MPINYENTDIKGVSYNGTSIDKVIYNGTVVWESIQHKTGNLYYPTSNTSLNPNFTISDWSSGAFDGDGSDKAWKVFGSGYYAKQASVSGQRCGAQILFNMQAEIYPIKIYFYGGNQDAGGGGGGGYQVVEARRPDGSWYELDRHEDVGGHTITMDGKTRITGLRMGTVYGSGPKKWLEANDCNVTEWNQKGTF